MPAWSGLYDGSGGGYAAEPKADALPPFQRGIVRVLMQNRAMHGHVTALGRNSPSAIARVDGKMGDMDVVGGYDYANRQNDAANEVTITNADQVLGLEDGETIARPTDATEADMVNTYDTTLRNGYPADAAATGVTSPAQTAVVSDGT